MKDHVVKLMVEGQVVSAGVDEVGRGAGAGLIYCCAVVLDPKKEIAGLTDSKKLTPKKREALAEQIKSSALAWCVSTASLQEIEDFNVLHATMRAMKRAVDGLSVVPEMVFVDGNYAPDLDIPTETVIKGDLKVPAISAASIVAKVCRDQEMVRLHDVYPEYRFDLHKGYLTSLHMEALNKYGPCEIHRRTYAPIRRLLDGEEEQLSLI